MFEHQDDDNLSSLFRKSARAIEENSEELSPSDSVWERLSKRLEEDEKTTSAELPFPKEKITDTSTATIANTIKNMNTTLFNNKKVWFSLAALFTGVAIGWVYLLTSSSKNEAINTNMPIAENSNINNTTKIELIEDKLNTTTITSPAINNYTPIEEAENQSNTTIAAKAIDAKDKTVKKNIPSAAKSKDYIPNIPGFKIELSDGRVSKKYDYSNSNPDNIAEESSIVIDSLNNMPSVGSMPDAPSVAKEAIADIELKDQYSKINNQNAKSIDTVDKLSTLHSKAHAAESFMYDLFEQQKTYTLSPSDNPSYKSIIVEEGRVFTLFANDILVVNNLTKNTEETYRLVESNRKHTKVVFISADGKRITFTRKKDKLTITEKH